MKQPNKQPPKKRFAIGRRVLLRLGKVGTVQSVAEQPAALGEYMHEVLVDGEAQSRRAMGCELEAVPDAQ